VALAAERHEPAPILLYNDECGVCRRIARWVKKSASRGSGDATIVEQPIGDDPEVLLTLNGDLDIWDAYETIHLLMPDGSMTADYQMVRLVLRRGGVRVPTVPAAARPGLRRPLGRPTGVRLRKLRDAQRVDEAVGIDDETLGNSDRKDPGRGPDSSFHGHPDPLIAHEEEPRHCAR
jgi:hypothetical protein